MEPLYRKVMRGKRPTYVEFKPGAEEIENLEIEALEVVSVLNTFGIAMIKMMEDQLPPSDILHRKIRNAKNELIALTSIGFTKPSIELSELCVEAWNASVRAIQDGLVRKRALQNLHAQ